MEGSLDRRLLTTDLRMALLLANDLRCRALVRGLGISRQDANLITLIGAGVLAASAHEKLERLTRGPGAPTAGDLVLSLATGREVLNRLAGNTFADTPVLADLLVPAMLVAALRELARPVRDRHPLRACRQSFAHRYRHVSEGVRRAYPPLQAALTLNNRAGEESQEAGRASASAGQTPDAPHARPAPYAGTPAQAA